jgi:hypothetical protein
MTSLYEADLYTWAMSQAEALRTAARLKLNTPLELDWENLAEEIETLGRSQARELSSRYFRLLAHLLKWEFHPDKRTSSWIETIVEQRTELQGLLMDNPGLKPQRLERFRSAYASAHNLAARETRMGSAAFPPECPYTLEQAMDPDFWPGPPSDPA